MELPKNLSDARLSRYALPVLLLLILGDIILGSSGVISREAMKQFLWIPVVFELALIALCLLNITRITRRYRALRREGRETMDAWQQALELVFPPRLARLALVEPRLYYALYLSYKRNRPACRTSDFHTCLDSYVFLVKVLIFICGLEIAAVSLLLPQRWLLWKMIHMILGLWAILWLWADARAMGFYGHKITEAGIHFRVGVRIDQQVLWENIAAAVRIGRTSPGFGPREVKNEPGCLYLAAGQNCNIVVSFHTPQTFRGIITDVRDVTRVYLSLDRPDEFLKIITAAAKPV